eukprot:1852778-Rhodomonas_salina.1
MRRWTMRLGASMWMYSGRSQQSLGVARRSGPGNHARAMAACTVGGTRHMKKQGGDPDNPTTLSEVMQSPDVKRWIKAINS